MGGSRRGGGGVPAAATLSEGMAGMLLAAANGASAGPPDDDETRQQHVAPLPRQHWASAARGLARLAAAPALWYLHGVSSLLSAGVDIASRLVGLALWWLLLPGRVAWWAVALPLRLALLPLRLLGIGGSSGVGGGRGGGGTAGSAGDDNGVMPPPPRAQPRGWLW